MRAIYADDADALAAAIESAPDVPALLSTVVNGLGLVHHIASADSVSCLERYLQVRRVVRRVRNG